MNNLYKLDIELQDGEIQPEAIAFNAMSSSMTESIHTWHQRLGHVSFKNWKKMQASDMVQGLYIKKAEAEDDLFCEGSIYGKSLAPIPIRRTNQSNTNRWIVPFRPSRPNVDSISSRIQVFPGVQRRLQLLLTNPFYQEENRNG